MISFLWRESHPIAIANINSMFIYIEREITIFSNITSFSNEQKKRTKINLLPAFLFMREREKISGTQLTKKYI